MTVIEAAESLGLEVLTGPQGLPRTITGACASDLLSYVMARAKPGYLWLTIQVHPNVVGVAELLELAAVVITDGQNPEPATLEKAREHGVTILTTPDPTYAVAGKLYGLGVR